MQQNNIAILCTRPLQKELVKEAAAAGISIDELSFIETVPVQSVEVQQEVEQALSLTATVVFTSMNAVEAVAEYMEYQKPEWQVYCIGTATATLVEQHFGADRIAGTADSAAALATEIAEDRFIDNVIFFCGNQRRDELPDILRKNDIEVTEIVVYQTITVPHKIDKEYNGILFFSPSAVDSFFSNNKLPQQTVLFAIGATTANTIKKFSNNNTITSDKPGKENLVKKMMAYFG